MIGIYFFIHYLSHIFIYIDKRSRTDTLNFKFYFISSSICILLMILSTLKVIKINFTFKFANIIKLDQINFSIWENTIKLWNFV